MGTPEIAVPSLEAVAATCDVVLVVTQPDRPRGRGRDITASPVGARAAALGLAVEKPESMRAQAVRERLAAAAPDLFAVVAFGSILTPEVLAVPRLGSINLHFSLLPEYRGASPVQRALWDGRAWTGVTTLWMDEGIDTGDCIEQQWESIQSTDDTDRLGARLASLGAPKLAESLLLAHAGNAPRVAQDRASGSYAGKLGKSDGIMDFKLDAVTVWNHARAVTPWPGATTAAGGRRLIVTSCAPAHLLPNDAAPGRVLEIGRGGVRVTCGRGALELLRVKPEGRSEMDAADWARGARLAAGDSLATHDDILKEAHA